MNFNMPACDVTSRISSASYRSSTEFIVAFRGLGMECAGSRMRDMGGAVLIHCLDAMGYMIY